MLCTLSPTDRQGSRPQDISSGDNGIVMASGPGKSFPWSPCLLP